MEHQNSNKTSKRLVTTNVANLLYLLVLALLVAETRAWRPFDSLDGPRHFSDYFQPPPSPLMQSFYASQAINLAPFASANQQQQQQLLTPMSSNSGPLSVNINQPPPPVQFSAPISSNQEQAVSSATPPPQPQEAQQEFSKPHEIGAREAPPQQDQAPTGSSSASSATGGTETLDGRDTSRVSASSEKFSKNQAEGTAGANEKESNEQRQVFSLVGKILDATLSTSTTNESKPTTSDGSNKLAASTIAPQQVLKPRKPGELRKAQTPASVEQQIIDQHARAAAGYNSHTSQYATSSTATTTVKTPAPQQRLTPATKNRASGGGGGGTSESSGASGSSKSLGAILFNSLGVLAGAAPDWSSGSTSSSSSSSSSSSEQQSSPISALMSNFKSGISSRSSIMKAAISDNKLARTLTSVSKTLGGNKYVASAGIAAALAALGLTVGKYMSPYSLSSGSGSQYSKLGEPLMTSGSYMSPSFVNYLGGNERQLALAQNAGGNPSYFDSMSMAASNNQPFAYDTQSYANTQDPQQQQQFDSTISFDPAALSQIAAAAGLYPSNQHAYAPPPPPGVYQNVQYINPMRAAPGNFKWNGAGGSSSQNAKLPFDSANGHYSNFYSQPAIDAASSAAPTPGDSGFDQTGSGNQMEAQNRQQASNRQYGTYISGAPSVTFANYGGNQDLSSLQDVNSMQIGQPNEQQQQANFDQMPSASLSAPSYQKAPAKQQFSFTTATNKQRAQSTPRRSGAVALKLDESTRSRLEQQLMQGSQQASLQPQATSNYNYFALNSPVQKAPAPVRATRQHSSSSFGQSPGALATNRWSATTASTSQSPAAMQIQATTTSKPVANLVKVTNSITGKQQQWRQPSSELVRQSSGHQFIKPVGARDDDYQKLVFSSLNAVSSSEPPSSSSNGKGRSQQVQTSDRGWKSIEESEGNNEVDSIPLAPVDNLSPLSQAAFEYAQADEPMPAASATNLQISTAQTQMQAAIPSSSPSTSTSGRRQQSEEDGRAAAASEQLHQLALLIDQQRALDQQRQADHTSDTEARATQREPAGGNHLFVVAANSIRDKSVEMGGKSNEVVKPKTTSRPVVVSTGQAVQQDNHDKTSKSNGQSAKLAPIIVGQLEEQLEDNNSSNNKQLDVTQQQPQQQAPGDNVVVELIDGAELFGGSGSELNATKQTTSQTATSDGSVATTPTGQRHQQQDNSNRSSSDNDQTMDENDELVGKPPPRAYQGLVAGSIGGAN